MIRYITKFAQGFICRYKGGKMAKVEILLLALLIIFMVSCSKQLPTNTPNNSNIQGGITSFSGEKIIDENNPQEYYYSQEVNWDFPNVEHLLYAFRITTSDKKLPDNIYTDEDGWIYHYLPNANHNIPLSSDDAQRTIWTTDKNFKINFHSENGELKRIITKFELKYKNNNNIESEIFSRSYFKSREIGTLIHCADGNIDGHVTGVSLSLLLNEKIDDIFVEGLYADHFMYRINIISEIDSTIISEGEWYNSINCENIREINLNTNSNPPLIPNNEGELTQFQAYVVNRNGVSDIDNPAQINFSVQEGFHPGSLIYFETTYALGSSHFINTPHPEEGIPFFQIDDNFYSGIPFWKDVNGDYVAIADDDFKIYLHYGWHGEYCEDNVVYMIEQNIILDEETNINYASHIMFFDIKVDGVAPSLEIEGSSVVDGWLRIPYTANNSQHPVINKELLESVNDFYGFHTIQVRAIDSQMIPDPTPAELTFKLVPEIPKEDKSGILLVDDDLNIPTWSFIDDTFLEILSDYSGEIAVLDRNEVSHSYSLSPTDLEPYELVIYHSEVVGQQSHFFEDRHSINLYLNQGGNLILSGNSNFKEVQQDFTNSYFSIFKKYFGISNTSSQDVVIAPNWNGCYANDANRLTFFVGAIAINEFTEDLSLNLDCGDPLIQISNALGEIVYFNNYYPSGYEDDEYQFETVEPIFGYGCRTDIEDEDDCDEFPNQAQFDFFNAQPVALKAVTENYHNICYIFGFPISYMNIPETKQMMNIIISEIEENKEK